jgi:hypothetical protein
MNDQDLRDRHQTFMRTNRVTLPRCHTSPPPPNQPHARDELAQATVDKRVFDLTDEGSGKVSRLPYAGSTKESSIPLDASVTMSGLMPGNVNTMDRRGFGPQHTARRRPHCAEITFSNDSVRVTRSALVTVPHLSYPIRSQQPGLINRLGMMSCVG